MTPKLYLHCKRCLATQAREDLEVILTTDNEIVVRCARHNLLVGQLTEGGVVTEELKKSVCGSCGRAGAHTH